MSNREKRIVQDCERILREGMEQLSLRPKKRDFWIDELNFYTMSICALRLGRFADAKGWLNKAVDGMVRAKRPLWLIARTVHEPIEAAILSCRTEMLDAFIQKSQVYASDPYPIYVYAMGLAHLAADRPGLCEPAIQYLQERKGVKAFSGWAKAFQAIIAGDSSALQNAIELVLISHDYDSRRGELRGSPHGYVSMSATALVALGRNRGLATEVESQYVPMGYIDFLYA